jgi:hypothetical protein
MKRVENMADDFKLDETDDFTTFLSYKCLARKPITFSGGMNGVM